MGLAFGLWWSFHVVPAMILLLVYAPDRSRRRAVRQNFGEYKFLFWAPFVLGKSLVQATLEWVVFDVLPVVHPLYRLVGRDYPRLKSNYLNEKGGSQ